MELIEELYRCEFAPNYQLQTNNALFRYDAAKLVKGAEDALVLSIDKHTGPVAALDFNPFQVECFAKPVCQGYAVRNL